MIPLFLIDHCSTFRRSVAAESYGGDVAYTANLVDEPCRLTIKSSRAFNSITAEWVVDKSYTLVVGAEADIVEGDRVTVTERENDPVTNAAGTAIMFDVVSGGHQRRGHATSTRVLDLRVVQ